MGHKHDPCGTPDVTCPIDEEVEPTSNAVLSLSQPFINVVVFGSRPK